MSRLAVISMPHSHSQRSDHSHSSHGHSHADDWAPVLSPSHAPCAAVGGDEKTHHSQSIAQQPARPQLQSILNSINGAASSSQPPPTGTVAAASVAITADDLSSMFRFFVEDFSTSRSFRQSDAAIAIQQRCQDLFALDYRITLLANANGELCSTYPMSIIIIEHEKSQSQSQPVNSAAQLHLLFKSSRWGRVHGRFPCPVILWRGRNVCRSSTLAISAESIINNVTAKTKQVFNDLYDAWNKFSKTSSVIASTSLTSSDSSNIVDIVSYREADERLLSSLCCGSISDLMVEHRKKKLGLTLTSSEKIEKSESAAIIDVNGDGQTVSVSGGYYRSFTLLPMCMPGCEFFTLYHRAGYNAVGLVYDWTQSFVDSSLQLDDEMKAGVELCNDGDDFDHDTHFECWQHKQQSQSQSQSHSIAAMLDRNANSDSEPAAPVDGVTHTGNPVRDAVETVLHNEEDSDTKSAGHRQPTASLSLNIDRDTDREPRWEDYRSWSIVTLTKNYLLLLLANLCEAPSHSASIGAGLLVHCLSGWDRTPLFISLLRLSLWADGEIHQSLSAEQMLYLTLSYDWMLFHHHLNNRLSKSEDILYFCFDFLQFITAKKFSIRVIEMQRERELVKLRGTGDSLSVSVSTTISNIPPQQQSIDDSPFDSSPLSIKSDGLSQSPKHKAKRHLTMDDGYFEPDQPSPTITVDATQSLPQSQSTPIAIPNALHKSHHGGSWTMIDMAAKGATAANSPSLSSVSVNQASPSLNTPNFLPVSSHSPSDVLNPISDDSGVTDLLASWTGGWTSSADNTDGNSDAQQHAGANTDRDNESASSVAARRCERLMAVRKLFLSLYSQVLPDAVPPPVLEHAPICPHYQPAAPAVSTTASTAPLITAPVPAPAAAPLGAQSAVHSSVLSFLPFTSA